MNQEITELCQGKRVATVNLAHDITYGGCVGEIIFSDGSKLVLGNDSGVVFADKPIKEKVYRVSYYTINGGRCKDFTGHNAETEANAFYNRHVKAHPEYQNTSWSKTSITTFDR